MDSQNFTTAERIALMALLERDLVALTQFVMVVREMEGVLGPAPQKVHDELEKAAANLIGDFIRFGASA